MPRPDRSRDALVTTTAVLLRRQGYASTGLAQIAAESGTTTGSLYHHFPGGKEELAAAALTLSADLVTARLQEAVAPPNDLARAMARWLRALARDLADDPRDGCPVAPVALEAVHASPRLQAAAAAAFATWAEVIAQRLRDDGAPRARAATTATAVLALVEGALLLARTSGDTDVLGHAARTVAILLRQR